MPFVPDPFTGVPLNVIASLPPVHWTRRMPDVAPASTIVRPAIAKLADVATAPFCGPAMIGAAVPVFWLPATFPGAGKGFAELVAPVAIADVADPNALLATTWKSYDVEAERPVTTTVNAEICEPNDSQVDPPVTRNCGRYSTGAVPVEVVQVSVSAVADKSTYNL